MSSRIRLGIGMLVNVGVLGRVGAFTAIPRCSPRPVWRGMPAVGARRGYAAAAQRVTPLALSTGDLATVDYSLKLEDGSPFTSFFEQGIVRLLVGHGGCTPALHRQLKEMGVGERKVVTLPPEETFGEYNPDLVTKLDLAEAPSGLETGMKLQLWTGQKARVTEVGETTFTIDMNPKDAGKVLVMDIEVLDTTSSDSLERATFAGGCFWGMELAFQRLPGVISTKVGYTQGHTDSPTYNDVCSGKTGHTEAVDVIFDPAVVTYTNLLELFYSRHDPTQISGQGNDRGTQYRTGVYYRNDEQRVFTEEFMKKVAAKYEVPLATELKPATRFHDAEDYHQQYLAKGGQNASKNAVETIRCYG